jgi:hypothetical protein
MLFVFSKRACFSKEYIGMFAFFLATVSTQREEEQEGDARIPSFQLVQIRDQFIEVNGVRSVEVVFILKGKL